MLGKGKSGTDSKLSGMVYTIDEQKDVMETYPEMLGQKSLGSEPCLSSAC